MPANAIAHIGLSTHSSDTEPGTTSESEAGTPSKETSNLDIELDPERAKYAEDMISLWNCLSKMKPVESLGLCDVETDIFKKIYNEVQIKPKNVQVNMYSAFIWQPVLYYVSSLDCENHCFMSYCLLKVNLKSCCVVPPDLKEFAKANNIKLLTHSDSPEFLGDSFCSKINENVDNEGNEKWKPLWIIRFQVFKKMRGVLQDKRYMIALQKEN